MKSCPCDVICKPVIKRPSTHYRGWRYVRGGLALNMHELRLAWETRSMILAAEMKLRTSLMRTASRCSHHRLDDPEIDDLEIDEENWRAWINIYYGEDGSMQLGKQPFDSLPA